MFTGLLTCFWLEVLANSSSSVSGSDLMVLSVCVIVSGSGDAGMVVFLVAL